MARVLETAKKEALNLAKNGGIHAVNVMKVADAAKTTRAQVCYHFGNTQGLIDFVKEQVYKNPEVYGRAWIELQLKDLKGKKLDEFIANVLVNTK